MTLYYFSLVIEDDEESYIAGSRPDWAKASNNIIITLHELLGNGIKL